MFLIVSSAAVVIGALRVNITPPLQILSCTELHLLVLGSHVSFVYYTLETSSLHICTGGIFSGSAGHKISVFVGSIASKVQGYMQPGQRNSHQWYNLPDDFFSDNKSIRPCQLVQNNGVIITSQG